MSSARRAVGWAWGLSVLMFLVLYGPALARGELFYSSDNYAFFFTGQQYWFESMKRWGSIQWWNPYINLGTSFLFNPTWGIFYPINYVQLFVSPETAYRTLWIFHFGLLIAGVIRWLRASGLHEELRILLPPLIVGSGLVNVFGVASVVYLQSTVWCVWLLSELAAGKLDSRASVGRYLAFWALLITNLEVTHVFIMGFVTLAFLAPRRKWGTLAVFGAASIVLAIAVYGHSALIIPYTTRVQGIPRDLRLSWSVHPLRVLTWIVPYFFGHPLHHNFEATSVVNTAPFNPRLLFDTLHIPLPLLILSAIGGYRAWVAKRWVPLSLVAFAWAMAFGKFGLMAVVAEVPPFKFLRYPEKMSIPAGLLLMSLALEVKNWREIGRDTRFRPEVERGIVSALVGLAIVLPFFGKTVEFGIAVSAAVLGLLIYARERRVIQDPVFLLGVLAVGFAQNTMALTPQRNMPGSTVGTLSELPRELMRMLPSNSWERLELAPEIQGTNDLPHRNFVFGTNMLYQRASLFGYDGVQTPFIDEAKSRLLDTTPETPGTTSFTPANPAIVRDLIQLTNLQVMVVRRDMPVQHLFPLLEQDARVFSIEKELPPWVFLSPVAKPFPVWWFPKLGTFEPGASPRISWPPAVQRSSHFLGGLERSGPGPESLTECGSPMSPVPFKGQDVIRKRDEQTYDWSLEAPCEGWVFFSHSMVPGWELTDKAGAEKPLFLINGGLVGIHVGRGRFEGVMRYRPWAALARKLTMR